ncbi:PIN domain-containing protein [Agrobacterium rosae]|uniref:PIN domain-containing protein n=1 Tax=Agrobacterium rosae TaxID=1972867 RepID=UPI002A0E35F4|nr:PIN domain-containing protein [Agrobacterium rosae]MDX8315181.1 PIN domain-containing protein [Agrobacterium rosae]
MIRLLIDTSVWLDLAKDYRHLPILDALLVMKNAGELDLILPKIIIEEFERNRERVIAESKRSLSSHFKLVREAMVKFAPEDGRNATLQQLNEVDHRIATGGEAVNDAMDMIETLFSSTAQIELTDVLKLRAADRAIKKVAPFHRQRNGIDDAILIETYIDAIAARQEPDDVFCFVTHNIHDFSERGGDTRLPHPDLAQLFDGSSSRYVTSLGPLLNEYAEDLLEEVRFDREYNHESQRLSDLLEAERMLTQQVWYNRKWVLIDRVEKERLKLVKKEEWDKAKPQKQRGMIVDTIWEGMLAP